MLLYLLRHAEAESAASSDFQRRLTLKGRGQAERIGEFCRKSDIAPAVILASPVLRARETAIKVAACLPGAELIEAPWAACGMSPDAAVRELRTFEKFSQVLLVAHEPDLSGLAATLLGISRSCALHVRKGLLMGIETGSAIRAGAGELQFFIPVNFLG